MDSKFDFCSQGFTENRQLFRHRGAIAGRSELHYYSLGVMDQTIRIHGDSIFRSQVRQLPGMFRAARNLRKTDILKHVADPGRTAWRCAPQHFRCAASGRNEPRSDLDESDIRFRRSLDTRAGHCDLAAATER